MNARTDIAELVKAAVDDAVKSLIEAAEERERALAAGLETVKADLAKALGVSDRHLSVVKYGKDTP